MSAPVPGPFRPGPPPSRPAPPPNWPPAAGVHADAEGGSTGHPAVDAAIQAMDNAVDLPPRDQIAQYEAAHQTLQETLATIDQA
ncbi:hypothetical protein SAMN05444365_11655 [Micromonospora pattaloongensis]|uniref:Uncharacterized protein n=1 Tax=Micromonospora pattaloongensis TaxID=405436 RepID=A0A1H3T1X5_9ACTN|nr:hypothetical protein [Micromonospora pattaloongensis]SDZ43957.1 hypothetical protein SAMN05444365_11655 [Micromonospora pattaloongensis]